VTVKRAVPSYSEFEPSSDRARAAARGASRKTDTQPELLLRRFLFQAGLRFRKDVASLPGRPDIAFARAQVAVFCDGDFWHGKSWVARKKKLSQGTNGTYWVAKIERNIARDREIVAALRIRGWKVLRYWESEIRKHPQRIAAEIHRCVTVRSKLV